VYKRGEPFTVVCGVRPGIGSCISRAVVGGERGSERTAWY
jgi:hypothetical protein